MKIICNRRWGWKPILCRLKINSVFTLIELMVVISIIIILISILLPALKKARVSVNTTACANNLKQLGNSMSMYCMDNEDYYPVTTTSSAATIFSWSKLLFYGGYTGNGDIFYCPALTKLSYSSPNLITNPIRCYGMNLTVGNCSYNVVDYHIVFRQNQISGPGRSMSNLLLLADSKQYLISGCGSHVGTWVSYSNASGNFQYRHAVRTNILFRDYHVDKRGRGPLYGNDPLKCIPQGYNKEWWFW